MVEPNAPIPTPASPDASTRTIDGLLRSTGPLTDSDPQRALQMAREAARLAGQGAAANLGLRCSLGRALILQGKALLELESFEQAIPCFLSALDCFNPGADLVETADANAGLGASYLLMAAYPEALEHLTRALTAYRGLDDSTGEAGALNRIGQLYLLLNEPAKALANLENALDQARRSANRRLEAEVLVNLCSAFRVTGRHQSAVQAGLRGVEIFQTIGYHRGEVEALNSLGEVYLAGGDPSLALNFLQLSAEVCERIGRRLELARALRKIGSEIVRQGQPGKALVTLTRALETAAATGSQTEMAECHLALSRAHKTGGDYRLALEHYEKAVQVQRSVFDAESDRRLKTIEIVHQVETARKDAEISQLRNVELQKEIEERKKAQAALEQLATQDGLTGLPNRRFFLELAGRALDQARRYGRPISAVMLDVDNFKHINDTFGHTAGDQVLAGVSGCMKTILRKVDILGRYGGDEFAIVLPETSQEGARRLTDRLRQAVAQQTVMDGGISMPITLSIGLTSSLSAPSMNLDQLLQRADQALYVSKQSGRNRVTAYEDTHPKDPSQA